MPARLGAGLLLLALGGCTGADVDLGSPDLSAVDRQACDSLLAAVPDTLAGKARRTDVGDGPGVVWGERPLVLRCGVGVPEGFDPARVPGEKEPAPCTIVSGVGWFVPAAQARGGETATFTAIGYRPRVSVTVLPEDQPEGGAAALAELAPLVKHTLVRRALDPDLAGPRPSPCA